MPSRRFYRWLVAAFVAAFLFFNAGIVLNDLGYAQYRKGMNAYTAGRYAEAEHHYRRAEAINREAFNVRFYRGVCLYHLGRYPEAAREIRAASGRMEASRKHNALGVSLLAQGDTDGAVRELTAAVKARPYLAVYQYNLALALIRAGRELEAKDHRSCALAYSGGASARWDGPIVDEAQPPSPPISAVSTR